jgi:hypothetical protein
MKSPKKSASWQDIRRILTTKRPEELLRLIRDLYALRPEVQDFLHARFLPAAQPFAPYKQTIQTALYPDVVHGEDIALARGRKAISEYKKATNDPIGTLDLMVYYIECGTKFTADYGDIDAWFYESLESMFTQVVTTLQHSEPQTIERFLPRLKAVVHQAENMGWGYYDAISETLEMAFPEDR